MAELEFKTEPEEAKTDEDVEATPDSLVKRDEEGRAKIASPEDDEDIANKEYVDEHVDDVVSDLPASSITSGALDTARIPNLDAGKITSGTFADARIPNLNASKTTAGAFAADRIPSLDAGKITSGAFADARIPNLNASKITAGTLGVDRRWANSVRAMANGNENISISASNTPSSQTVTFPAGRFSATPAVMVSANTSVPGTLVTGVSYSGASSTGVTLWVTRTNTTSTNVSWLAVQI